MNDIHWADYYAIIDVAAGRFQSRRPLKEDEESVRRNKQSLRGTSVKALRFVWRRGDPSIRAMLATVLAASRGADEGYLAALSNRIERREQLRKLNAPGRAKRIRTIRIATNIWGNTSAYCGGRRIKMFGEDTFRAKLWVANATRIGHTVTWE